MLANDALPAWRNRPPDSRSSSPGSRWRWRSCCWCRSCDWASTPGSTVRADRRPRSSAAAVRIGADRNPWAWASRGDFRARRWCTGGSNRPARGGRPALAGRAGRRPGPATARSAGRRAEIGIDGGMNWCWGVQRPHAVERFAVVGVGLAAHRRGDARLGHQIALVGGIDEHPAGNLAARLHHDGRDPRAVFLVPRRGGPRRLPNTTAHGPRPASRSRPVRPRAARRPTWCRHRSNALF